MIKSFTIASLFLLTIFSINGQKNDSNKVTPKEGGVKMEQKKNELYGYAKSTYNALNNEWNECEVIVMGNAYTIHKLNGEIVNMATNLSVSEGIIGFQSETAEIYYRNIKIKEFDEIIPIEKFIKL